MFVLQSTPQKDFVFHLAKTPEKNEKNTAKFEQNIPITIKTLNDIQDSSIAEHAKYVIKENTIFVFNLIKYYIYWMIKPSCVRIFL